MPVHLDTIGVNFKGQGHRSKFMATAGINVSVSAVDARYKVTYFTDANDISLVICQVLWAEVVSATSS